MHCRSVYAIIAYFVCALHFFFYTRTRTIPILSCARLMHVRMKNPFLFISFLTLFRSHFLFKKKIATRYSISGWLIRLGLTYARIEKDRESVYAWVRVYGNALLKWDNNKNQHVSYKKWCVIKIITLTSLSYGFF